MVLHQCSSKSLSWKMASSTMHSFQSKSVRIASNQQLWLSPDDRNPWGALLWRQQPKGVMNVVRWQSDSCSGTLWYPLQASVTVYQVLCGICLARWNGDSALWVSLWQCLFRADRLTIHLGDPSNYHATEPFHCFSKTPSNSSRSKSVCAWPCQWIGTGMVLRLATGVTLSLR